MPFPWNKKNQDLHQTAQRPVQDWLEGRSKTGIVDGTINTGPWNEVKDPLFTGLDLVVFASGTVSRVMPHFPNTVHHQQLENHNMVSGTDVVTTPPDDAAIRKGLSTPDESVVLSSRQGGDTFMELHPNQAVLIHGIWETLGNHIGCGSDPEFCANVLRVDPLAAKSVERLVEQTIAQLRRHNLTGGCSVMELIGFGGSGPLGEYMYELFGRQMEVNRRHRVLYLGSPSQTPNRRIARAWLGEYLSEPIPSNTLLYVVSLDSPGPQPWDLSLIHGLLSITATDRYRGQADAPNNFKKLKEHGDIVEVKAHVLPMPLRQLEKRSRLGRRDIHYVLQDSPIPSLLALLQRRIAIAPYSYRGVVFAGDFTNEEIAQLQGHAPMLAPKGQLDTIINRMKPLTHDHAVADYYMIEFCVPDGQAQSLVNLAGDDSLLPHGSAGLGREELATRLAQGSGGNGSSTYEAIQTLLESRR